MLEVKGKPLVRAIDNLRNIQEIVHQEPTWLIPTRTILWFDELVEELTNLGCRQTLKKIASIRFHFEQEHPHHADYEPSVKAASFNSSLKEVWSRLADEIEDQKLYCVSGRDAEYLGTVVSIYGETVVLIFNEQLYDLEEAAKCIAFARGTASVFHLMRIMEAAVLKVGDELSVTVADKNGTDLEWGKILANIRVPIEAMSKGVERDQWSEIQSLLYHVKQAWRNNTMHPKQTYTLEEAEDVFGAVKTFLRRLSPLL